MTVDRASRGGASGWWSRRRDAKRKRRAIRNSRRRQLLLEPLERRAMLATVSMALADDNSVTAEQENASLVFTITREAEGNEDFSMESRGPKVYFAVGGDVDTDDYAFSGCCLGPEETSQGPRYYVYFGQGEPSVDLNVHVRNDSRNEDDETLTLTVTNVVGEQCCSGCGCSACCGSGPIAYNWVNGQTPQATVTIQDDDDWEIKVERTSPQDQIPERGGTASFKISRVDQTAAGNGDDNYGIKVEFEMSGDAAEPADYRLSTDSQEISAQTDQENPSRTYYQVTIPKESDSVEVTLAAKNDSENEDHESAELTITGGISTTEDITGDGGCHACYWIEGGAPFEADGTANMDSVTIQDDDDWKIKVERTTPADANQGLIEHAGQNAVFTISKVDTTPDGNADPTYPIKAQFSMSGDANDVLGDDGDLKDYDLRSGGSTLNRQVLLDENGDEETDAAGNLVYFYEVTIPREPESDPVTVTLHPTNDAKREQNEPAVLTVIRGVSVQTTVEADSGSDACCSGDSCCGGTSCCGTTATSYTMAGGHSFDADVSGNSATVTIIDDDDWEIKYRVIDEIAIEPCTWISGAERNGAIQFDKILGPSGESDPTYAIKVEFTLGGTATPASSGSAGDYHLTTNPDGVTSGDVISVSQDNGVLKGTATIPEGSDPLLLYVMPNGDKVFEADETVILTVSKAYPDGHADQNFDLDPPPVADNTITILQAPEFLSEDDPPPLPDPIPINADGYHHIIGAASKAGAKTIGDTPIKAMAPDGRTFKYSIEPELDGAMFQVHSDTGEITAKPEFTAPQKTTYYVKIKVYDVAEPQLYDLATVSITLINFRIREVDYLGNHSLVSDPNSQNQTTSYAAPNVAEWYDHNFSGTAGDEAGERRYPVAYTRNDVLKLNAKIKIDATGLPAGWADEVMVSATGNHNGLEIRVTEPTVAGDLITITNVSANSNGNFHNKIDYLPSFELDWKVSLDNGANWIDVGTSSNPVYLTYKDPATSPLYHTLVHIGSTNGKNAADHDNEGAVADAIWAPFDDLNVHKVAVSSTWQISEGAQLSYWKTAYTGQDGLFMEYLLAHGDGRCGAWSYLFENVLKGQGITSGQIKEIKPVSFPNLTSQGILIKKWGFPAQPNFTLGPYQGYLAANVIDQTGLEAQYNDDPRANFVNHFVFVYDGKLWDPSYGTTYDQGSNDANLLAWEKAQLAGVGVIVDSANVQAVLKQLDNELETYFTN